MSQYCAADEQAHPRVCEQRNAIQQQRVALLYSEPIRTLAVPYALTNIFSTVRRSAVNRISPVHIVFVTVRFFTLVCQWMDAYGA